MSIFNRNLPGEAISTANLRSLQDSVMMSDPGERSTQVELHASDLMPSTIGGCATVNTIFDSQVLYDSVFEPINIFNYL